MSRLPFPRQGGKHFPERITSQTGKVIMMRDIRNLITSRGLNCVGFGLLLDYWFHIVKVEVLFQPTQETIWAKGNPSNNPADDVAPLVE